MVSGLEGFHCKSYTFACLVLTGQHILINSLKDAVEKRNAISSAHKDASLSWATFFHCDALYCDIYSLYEP